MGARVASFRDEDMTEMLACTTLNKTEIYHTFRQFQTLYEQYEVPPGELLRAILENGYINPDVTLPTQHITHNFPPLKVNPLSERICKVFSDTEGQMSFLEFLDMVSAFNPKTSVQVRSVYAFRVFDMDSDGIISRKDLQQLLDLITGTGEEDTDDMWQRTKDVTIDGVLREVNKEVNSDGISREDFGFAISRSPDFISTFSFRL